MSNPYSIDVTIRVVVEAESQHDAEALFEKQLFRHFTDAEYYNLKSRKGSWSALYVGDSTDDTDVWRPTTGINTVSLDTNNPQFPFGKKEGNQ